MKPHQLSFGLASHRLNSDRRQLAGAEEAPGGGASLKRCSFSHQNTAKNLSISRLGVKPSPQLFEPIGIAFASIGRPTRARRARSWEIREEVKAAGSHPAAFRCALTG